MSTTPPSFNQAEYLDDEPVINAPAKPDTAVFTRSILFGIGGGLLGAALYAGFITLTHINIGYLAIAVAWLVAKGMITGSRGQGGRYYQIASLVLTYLAMTIANAAIVAVQVSRNGVAIHPKLNVILYLLKIGFEYPFLEFTSGENTFGAVIGLVILFVGLRAAWRMMSGIPGAVRHPFAR